MALTKFLFASLGLAFFRSAADAFHVGSSGQSVLKDAEAKVGSAWESTKEFFSVEHMGETPSPVISPNHSSCDVLEDVDLHKKRKRTGECPVDEAVEPPPAAVPPTDVCHATVDYDPVGTVTFVCAPGAPCPVLVHTTLSYGS